MRVAREEAAPCLTEGMESSRLEKNRGSSSGRLSRHSAGNDDMKFPQARQAAALVWDTLGCVCVERQAHMY